MRPRTSVQSTEQSRNLQSRWRRRMACRRTIVTTASLGCIFAVLTAILAVRWSLRLAAPHRVAAAQANLGVEVLDHLDRAAEALREPSVDDIVTAAMRFTGDLLRFGLGHRTSLRFDGLRAGNCVEYANLFGYAFNRIAQRHRVPAQAVVVRSYDVRVLGVRLPFRSWRDHDWVAIKSGDEVRFVDPTFADAFLGADLTRNVRGPVPIPASGGKHR